MKLYTITVDEEQLRLLNAACEDYFRIRMGQFDRISDDVAGQGVDFSPELPNHKEIFDRFIQRRDASRVVFEAAFRVATDDRQNSFGIKLKGDDCQMAYELHQAIRHKLWQDNDCKPDWCVDGDRYISYTEHMMPIVEEVESDA